MKISIGTNIMEGPWGGGNLFAINLSNYLKNKGHIVVSNLEDDDIDLILMTEPRKTSESSSFTHIDIMKYISFVKQDTLVVHRINECDERKDTNFVNRYLVEANKVAHATVFVSAWLKELFVNQGLSSEKNFVILSGADKKIFNRDSYVPWDKTSKLKLVTHHWGAHWNKGFEIYKELDEMLGTENFKDKIQFTYIGNLPKKFHFKNSKVVSPISGEKLANEVKANHIYLTASKNEPSGNHHIEGAQCGLPILYLDSGGTPEYCDGYGVKFDSNNFKAKLNHIIEDYSIYVENMKNYPNDSELMCGEYEELFSSMFSDKHKFLMDVKSFYNLNFFIKYSYIASREIKKYFKK